MRRDAAICCLSAALLLTGCGSSIESAGSETFERADAAKLVLGPRDLGPGYAMGDDSACGELVPEEHAEKFMEFMYEMRPTGCRNEIAYIWVARRATLVPRAVDSGVVIFKDEEGARRGLEMRAELVRFMVPISPPDRFEPLPELGHDAMLFREKGDQVPPTSGVIWRDGNAVAIVFARGEGMTREKADAVAVELAGKQQDRMENPQAQEPAEKMDLELPLDDPGLDVPVYWLGRRFEPGGELPAIELGRSWAGNAPVELGWTVEMDYGSREPPSGVKISVFSPAAFERFEDGVVGRQVAGARCAEYTKRKVPNGHAVIWRGFAKPVDEGEPCPNRAYDRFVAYVYLKDAVVAVNHPWCIYPCSSPTPGNPYNTERGVTAIAANLQVRKPRGLAGS